MIESTVQNFIECCTGLSRLDLEIGSSGNLSIRDGNEIIIKPTGIGFSQVSKNKLSVLNLNDASDIFGMKPSSDTDYHKKIYLERQDVRAILHTHSHYVVLLSMLGLNIPVLNTMHADYFGASIECVPFSNHRKTGFGDIEYFNNGEAFLLSKHGGLILFTETDVEKITNTLSAFAEICRLYYDYLLYSKLFNIKTETLLEEDLALIHEYYKKDYGIKSK